MSYSSRVCLLTLPLGRLFVKTLRHDTYPSIDPAKWVAPGDFVGRVVMITGANRGLGRVMASAFARAGVSGLVLAARNASALETVEEEARAVHPGGDLKIQKISVDVVDEIAVSNAARSVKDTFNRLDVLVNNAGILEKMAVIGKSDPDTWWKTWEVDVKGTYLVTRAFLELLLESGNGGVGDLEGRKIVVNLASIAANMVVADGGSAYHVCAHLVNFLSMLTIFTFRLANSQFYASPSSSCLSTDQRVSWPFRSTQEPYPQIWA